MQAKTVAQALALHHTIDSGYGGEHHHLARAALDLREQMPSADFDYAMLLNKAAGRAKHNVSINRHRTAYHAKHEEGVRPILGKPVVMRPVPLLIKWFVA